MKTRQYDLLRPRVGQKEPPRLGSAICYGHRDSAVRFVTAKTWPERATKTRQYDLLRPRVGQKEPPRLGSTICYGQTWATETPQYDLLRPNVGQKEPPRLGSTICYGQTWARKSHQDSAVRFVTAKSWPERATKTRQYDLLRPRVGQKEPPRLGSTICYGQTWVRKSHRDSAVRFVTAKRGPERATETRQYDLLRPNVGQKEPPRLGSTICYGQTWARKSHQDSAVRFVTAKRGPEKSHRDSAVRFVTAKRGPERATKTRQYDLLRPRQYDLLRPNVGQKEPPRLGSTICYGQEFGQKEPPRLGSTICYGQTCARRSHQDSAIRFVTAKNWPERATKTRQYDLLRPRVGQKEPTKTRQYDLLRPNVGQKEPPRLGSTSFYGQTWARKSHQDSAVRFVTAKDLARKSHQDSAVRFVTAKRWPEGATKTRQYDLLRPTVGQKEPPRLGSTICYGQTWARKSHRDSAVRFVTAKRGPERATRTRQYDLLQPRVGQKEPPRLGNTICYGQGVGQKEPPRLGSTICYGQELARKSHQDSAVRFLTAKSWPERATKTRQYDLLRPRVGQKEPPRLGSTILRPNVGQIKPPRLGRTFCYGQ